MSWAFLNWKGKSKFKDMDKYLAKMPNVHFKIEEHWTEQRSLDDYP